MQSRSDLQQQGTAADVPSNGSGGQTSTTQDKKKYQTGRLLLNQSRENTLADDDNSSDLSSITIPEMPSKMESKLDNTPSRSGYGQFSLQEMKNEIKILQDYRDREYLAGVVSIRNQLAQMFLSSTQIAQRKSQAANPIDVRINVYDQDEIAYDVNLATTINLANRHPDYYDICVDTVFGAPKDLINQLRDWDPTGEYQVYDIFSDHGEAWHEGFANTCPKPFETWLSSIICLQNYESAISHDTSPDLEILLQDQKEKVKKSIQEWKEAYFNDRFN
ncbi:hypothetical protein EAE96_004807 [Botrytis aclada]|nr:hypothetical protein EAE96_004807 [Botrytis aclada]